MDLVLIAQAAAAVVMAILLCKWVVRKIGDLIEEVFAIDEY